MSTEDIPPILQVKGLRVIDMGTDKSGAFIKLAADRGPVREVTIYMVADRAVAWTYVYATWDAATRTVATYEGIYGDPAKDHLINIGGK